MLGLDACAPWRSEITQLRFDAFHFESDGASAGEMKRDEAAWRIRNVIGECKELDHGSGFIGPDFVNLGPFYAVKTQRTSAPAKVGRHSVASFGRKPIEAACYGGKAILGGKISHLGKLEDGVLKIGRNDFKVVVIEGDELQRFGMAGAH